MLGTFLLEFALICRKGNNADFKFSGGRADHGLLDMLLHSAFILRPAGAMVFTARAHKEQVVTGCLPLYSMQN